MYTILGHVGPPWYAEGIAELMGTHRWENGQLTLDYFPHRPREVPKLGRVEIVQTEFSGRRAMRLNDVLHLGPRAHEKDVGYAWSWALAAFLDNHPRYRDRFRTMPTFVADPQFNSRFAETFAGDGAQLAEEWQVFVANIDYGYDFNRTQLDFTPGKELPLGGTTVAVAADRGWQNSGIRLEAGKAYQLAASGQYQVGRDEPPPDLLELAQRPQTWLSEPNGVSIHYVHGRPLGILLAAVRPDETSLRHDSAGLATGRRSWHGPAAGPLRHAVSPHEHFRWQSRRCGRKIVRRPQ